MPAVFGSGVSSRFPFMSGYELFDPFGGGKGNVPEYLHQTMTQEFNIQ